MVVTTLLERDDVLFIRIGFIDGNIVCVLDILKDNYIMNLQNKLL